MDLPLWVVRVQWLRFQRAGIWLPKRIEERVLVFFATDGNRAQACRVLGLPYRSHSVRDAVHHVLDVMYRRDQGDTDDAISWV